MNRFERTEIKQIILAHIEQLTKKRLIEKQSHLCQSPGDELRLERLETALRRVDGENFGECFKCEKPIGMDKLRITPESIICADCLK